MKKNISLLLIVAIALCPLALAESPIDFDGMTYDQLLELRAQVDAAIWASDEWEEVTVPVGVYLIGRDIPAGRWVITATEDSSSWRLYDYMDEEGNLRENSFRSGSMDAGEFVVWELHDGNYLNVENDPVVFTHSTGSELDFK